MIIKEFVKAVVISTVTALAVMAPNLYSQYNLLTAHQREFKLIELKSLKSEYGVCEVLLNSNRKDLQDIMRDVCEKNVKRQAELTKQLES